MKTTSFALIALLAVAAFSTTAPAATAELQVIHNAADPGAAVVDVYVGNDLFIDEFAFRSATEFKTVPAGVTLDIGVAPGGNSSPGDILATFPVTLEAGKRYVAIANGVLDPAQFDDSANGSAIGFNLFARDGIRSGAFWDRLVNLIAFHGATDAPTVDVRIRDSWWNPLFDDLSYGDFSYYRSVYAKKYILDVTPGNDKDTVVASYEADLSGLGGGAAVVFASGFLNAPANQNGEPFGLFAALPDGTVVPLAPLTGGSARAYVQVVHNAADPAAAEVDVYVDGELALDNFAFRTATPFLELDAGREIEIAVAGPNSTGIGDAGDPYTFTLAAGTSYALFANGVLSTKDFEPNPDGIDITFDLFARPNVQQENPYDYIVKFLAFHGATDAPAVDVVARGKWFSWRVIRDLEYSEFSDYRWLFPRKYVLDVTPAGSNAVVASFEADLSGLAGGTAIVFASGFLSPGNDQNGPAFGLFAVLTDGTVLALPQVTGNKTVIADGPILNSNGEAPKLENALGQNYPNPFNPRTTIAFELAQEAPVNLRVFNARGQVVATLVNETLAPGPYEFDFDGAGLASGVYFYRLDAGGFQDMRKMLLLK